MTGQGNKQSQAEDITAAALAFSQPRLTEMAAYGSMSVPHFPQVTLVLDHPIVPALPLVRRRTEEHDLMQTDGIMTCLRTFSASLVAHQLTYRVESPLRRNPCQVYWCRCV